MSQKRGGRAKEKDSSAAKRRSILVFTEGKKTEPIYLMHWTGLTVSDIIVTIDEFHGAPLQLVEEAADPAHCRSPCSPARMRRRL